MERLFITLILLLSLGTLKAQQTLNLEECRGLAIQNNKKLKMAEEEINAAKAMKEEAFTKYLPGVDAMGTYMRNQKEINLLEHNAYLPVGTFGADGKFVPNVSIIDGKPAPNFAILPKEAMTVDDRNTAILQVGLTQPIYMGGKIRAYNQLAGLSQQLAETGREQELQDVILSVDEAYWQVVSLVHRGKLAEKFVEALTHFERDVQIMYETGVATRADVLSVRVKLNEAEMLRTKVDNGIQLSRMLLSQLCGLSTDTLYALREESAELNSTPTLRESTMEEVYSQRPEVMSLQLATEMYKKKEKIARSEYLPTVAFMANYFTSTPSFFNGISTKFDGMWSVGIGIKAPIFHWGASRKTVRQAEARTSIMNYKLQDAREKIELQVNQSRFRVKEVAKKLEMGIRDMERADENLKFANLGFEEGTIPVLNVLEAQTAWLSAQAQLIDIRIEAKLCEVYLQKAYGTLGRVE